MTTPRGDSDDYRSYMRKYMKDRYTKRRKEMVITLGSKCARCGSMDDLHIDHIDPSKKTMSVERMAYVSRQRQDKELENCQLLCQPCHTEKTVVEDLGRVMAKGTHGTLSSSRYCKCDRCTDAKRMYMKEYKRKRRTPPATGP